MTIKIIQMGRHTIALDEDLPLLVTRVVGDLDMDNMRLFFSLLAQYSDRGPVHTIADLTHGGTITPDARRFATEQVSAVQLGGGACFGMNAVLRVVFMMMTRSVAVLRPQAHLPVVQFLRTEAAARAYIAAFRRREKR